MLTLHQKGYLFAFAALLCYSTVPLFLKFLAGHLDAWTVNAMRYSIAALVWLPFVLRGHKKVPEGRNVWLDACIPTFVNIFGQTLWAFAPYYTDASVIAFVIRLNFLFAIIFGFWLLPEERSLSKFSLFWFGVSTSFIGIVIMYMEGLHKVGSSFLGLSIVVSASLFWGIYGVVIKKKMSGYSSILSFGVVSLYTSTILILSMLVFGQPRTVLSLNWDVLSILVVSAIFGIAFSHVLIYKAIHILGPVTTNGSTLFGPFVTALFAYFIFSEKMTLYEWIGGVTLVLGSYLLLRAKLKLGRL